MTRSEKFRDASMTHAGAEFRKRSTRFQVDEAYMETFRQLLHAFTNDLGVSFYRDPRGGREVVFLRSVYYSMEYVWDQHARALKTGEATMWLTVSDNSYAFTVNVEKSK